MSGEQPNWVPARVRRLVIKIGSGLLVDRETGELRHAWLAALAEDIARQAGAGSEIMVVSSGAIALGRQLLKLPSHRPLTLEDSQAAAAAGQIRLAHAYQEALQRQQLAVAQILLTIEDTERRRRYLNARSTLTALLRHGTIPIINENDTVATEEIRFGDNDRLAARVAVMMGADHLLLLSDIDGLYSANPKRDASASHIPVVRAITGAIEAMAEGSDATTARGGMTTKVQAAQIAYFGGCTTIIGDGRASHPLARFADGARGTWFIPPETPKTARKQWIAGSLQPTGILTIDPGAKGALQNGKSLLPAGVTAVSGRFERGDAVSVVADGAREIARGLVAYSAADCRRIMGQKSQRIAGILGYSGRQELIHRDDLVLL